MNKSLLTLIFVIGVLDSNAQSNSLPSSGNVLINTSDVTGQKLQVNGYIDITGGSTAGRALRFYDGTNFSGGIGNNLWALGGSAFDLGLYTPGNIVFGANNYERFRISSNGNVGIGTASPGTKLVVGTLGSSMPTWQSAWFQDGIGIAPNGSSTATYVYSNGSNLFGINAYDYENGEYKPISVGWGGAHVLLARDGGYVGVGTVNPQSQLHLASDNNHSFTISRANGSYGFRIYRDAVQGNVFLQIGNTANTWETKIKIGEGEGTNTKLLLNPDGGNVGIGTESPSEKLSVNGNISTKKVIVTQLGWSDYVFNDDYKLKPLSDVANFIKENKHLPDIPSAKEVEKRGVDLGENQALLLKKIEELTLYVIDLRKEIEILKKIDKK